MNRTKLLCLTSLLIANISFATSITPCNEFEISLKNNLSDDLIITKGELKGATLQPDSIQILNSKSQFVFTVYNSTNGTDMQGTFVFHTISLPSKHVEINFDLKNALLICEHTDKNSGGDYEVSKSRSVGRVTYTIGN